MKKSIIVLTMLLVAVFATACEGGRIGTTVTPHVTTSHTAGTSMMPSEMPSMMPSEIIPTGMPEESMMPSVPGETTASTEEPTMAPSETE